MQITTTDLNGRTIYHFSKGAYVYEASLSPITNGLWEIWTTDTRRAAPDNRSIKAVWPQEMKAKVWVEFFNFVNSVPQATENGVH